MENDDYDYFTSTVDGAAGFERMRVGRPSKYPEEYYPEDAYEERDDKDDSECECGCSDPGCPCGGIKRGGL